MSRCSVLLCLCLIISVASGYSPSTHLGRRSSTARKFMPYHHRDVTTSIHADVATSDLESQRESATHSFSMPLKERLSRFVRTLSSDSDGLTFRQRVTNTGVYFAMSYNILSQLNGGCSMSIAWYLFSVKTGLSPLSPGQWKAYLAFYAGFWVVNNFLRPFRMATAVALAPRMELLTERVQNRFQMARKSRAATLTFAVTYMTAVSFSASLVALATLLSGVPIFPCST